MTKNDDDDVDLFYLFHSYSPYDYNKCSLPRVFPMQWMCGMCVVSALKKRRVECNVAQLELD